MLAISPSPGLPRPLEETPYRLLDRIGAGGMGEVYAAEHAQLGKPVVLKLLHAHLADEPSYTSLVSNEDGRARRVGPGHEHLIEELAALPESERRAVVHAANEQARARTTHRALLGLMADVPDLVNDVCSHAYAERAGARMRDLVDE